MLRIIFSNSVMFCRFSFYCQFLGLLAKYTPFNYIAPLDYNLVGIYYKLRDKYVRVNFSFLRGMKWESGKTE